MVFTKKQVFAFNSAVCRLRLPAQGDERLPDGPDAFVCTVEVAVSPNFFGWLASFGARAQILSPEPVREAFVALCREAEAANS